MLRVGLTGGLACGKSTVAKIFAGLGAHIIYADQLAHDLYRPGERVYQDVVRQFGPEILQKDGQIDRARLGALAFSGGRIQELNRIVHPAVITRQEELIDQIGLREQNAVVMVEAALIFEVGGGDKFSKNIVVTCRPEQKVARFALRARLDEVAAAAEVERRSKAQMSDGEKIKRADYVVDNSGSLEQTRQQVEKIWAKLKQEAAVSA